MKTGKVAMSAAGVLAAVVTLFFITLDAAPDGPPTGVEHDVTGASAECLRAVNGELPAARFPFSPTALYLGDRRYRLNGTADGEIGTETVRRSYECLIRYEGSGQYRADSVAVWQTH